MPYCEGLENSIWVVPPLLPAELVPLLLLFLNAVIFFFCMIHSFINKHNVLAMALMFLISLLFFVGSFFIDHQRIYLYGFKNYAKDVLTTEEWRSISRFAQTHLKPGDYLGGPEKTVQDDGERKLWSQFTNQTLIQKLGPYVMISVPDPRKTEIEWGGALVGHRAVIICSNTNDISPPNDVFRGPLFFAPDIAVYIENN